MTEQDWLKQIEESPGDWDLYGIFADWLEEIGDSRVEAIREQIRRRQVPTYSHGGNGFFWYKNDYPPITEPITPSPRVGSDVFKHLTGWEDNLVGEDFRYYKTITRAVIDLWQAFVKAKEKGYEPD